ncbi:hypothetical protein GCM10027586_08430 [Kineococcus gypseus]
MHDAAHQLHGSGPRVIAHEHGLWVHVSQEPAEAFEGETVHLRESFPHLLAALRLARVLGSDVFWINFDADGERHEQLPVYEW